MDFGWFGRDESAKFSFGSATFFTTITFPINVSFLCCHCLRYFLCCFLQKAKVLSGTYLYTWKYNACITKLAVKVLRFNKIRVKNILLLAKYLVHNFWLLPLNALHRDNTCSVYSSICLTCSPRCIITT